MYEDVQYLERLGCYRVPSRALLDEFVKAYFRYIHPHQPILDEGDFWRVYTSPPTAQPRTISIFVFQAMLFAACSFVSFSTIHQLGFDGFHDVRATFYRRAKALFHIDSYRDTLSSAQGALLLTHYVSSSDAKVNTYWLSNAIYLAKSVNIHRRESRDSLNKATVQGWSQFERLWCCCLLRDRLLALGLRRSMQIDAEDTVLSEIEDIVLPTKAEESMVYDSTTKLALTRSFSALCSLAAPIKRTLGILSLDPPYSDTEETTMASDKIQACSERLDHWFTKSKVDCNVDGSTNTALILHKNIMYIYYHSAKVALWNHAMYISVTHGCAMHMDLSEGRREVERAIQGIDASLQQISDHGMLSFMPIAIVAHIAIPLVQHILNIKAHGKQHVVSSQKRLSVYITALSGLKERYEGVDRVLCHIRQIVMCLDAHEMPSSLSSDSQLRGDSSSNNSDRVDNLIHLPRLFLREMIAVQLALAKGQYPEEHELHPRLASRAGSDAYSTCTCLSHESWNLPDLGDAFDSLMDILSPAGLPGSQQPENVYVNCGTMTEKPNSLAIVGDFDHFPEVLSDM
ncbi:Fungal specific transcription factor domain-containing protein [Cladophialophora immunda]|nr:Fungal specific transcription factor domain-containing protein [Cladophialophora immunda]